MTFAPLRFAPLRFAPLRSAPPTLVHHLTNNHAGRTHAAINHSSAGRPIPMLHQSLLRALSCTPLLPNLGILAGTSGPASVAASDRRAASQEAGEGGLP
jgi:hypothetical protein